MRHTSFLCRTPRLPLLWAWQPLNVGDVGEDRVEGDTQGDRAADRQGNKKLGKKPRSAENCVRQTDQEGRIRQLNDECGTDADACGCETPLTAAIRTP